MYVPGMLSGYLKYIYIYIYIFKKKREEIIGFIPYLISRKKTYLIIGKNVKNVR
jgi:hypothetical protein